MTTITFKQELGHVMVYEAVDDKSILTMLIHNNDTFHISHSDVLKSIYMTFETFAFTLKADDLIELACNDCSYFITCDELKTFETPDKYNLTTINDLLINIIYKGTAEGNENGL